MFVDIFLESICTNIYDCAWKEFQDKVDHNIANEKSIDGLNTALHEYLNTCMYKLVGLMIDDMND